MSATNVFLYKEKRWLLPAMVLTQRFLRAMNREKLCAKNSLFRKESRLFFTPAIYMIGRGYSCLLKRLACCPEHFLFLFGAPIMIVKHLRSAMAMFPILFLLDTNL